MKENIVKIKSFAFAKRIVKLYEYLCEDKKEYIMSKQLMRCGTSVGANIFEGENSVSSKEFSNKLSIALKEANECQYWIQLLYETEYLSIEQYNSIMNDCVEMNRLLVAIVKTIKSKIDN